MADVFEVKKNGETILSSPLKNGDYSKQTLLSMIDAGYKPYCNGKVLTKTAIAKMESSK